MANSKKVIFLWLQTVVNCFQISNFVLWQTAAGRSEAENGALWIAFKLVILSYGKQQNPIDKGVKFCCELLSN